ncbi:cation:proton antiporter [Parapusillimonas granuli]|uniref:Cation:proton antiporter n=1 Tax=Parapusillimonas granuli TaxID=380911 RepID=A0A853FQ14_9BURK|nr:cation:proton antiporter [Parapusillimonas granuli]MBB5216207.1 CPA1 family monovalent cation:H+ antiporter [Parapusillimonas granuli]MEB2400482.1 cation:proton antiporter [Alcaligenaceae bacterium]NYT47884.1 cation:proton antiporter [Parapusillimonas granuli]
MQIGHVVFGLAGLLALVSFMPPLAGRLRLPHSVLLAIVGFVLGLVIHVHSWAPLVMSDFLDSLQNFEISSEAFLFIFLPVLLFETALSLNVRRLLDDIGPILMMAIVAVIVCTVFVGFSLDAASGYGLTVCLMLGAIVATTDPIAVVGVFREVGAPKRLTTLVEGESLFNDAASIALYSVLLTVMYGGGELSAGKLFYSFTFSFLGGGVAGFLMGRLASGLFIWLRGWPTAEITLTVALAYLTFYVSEHYFGVSGVVATVIAGLVVGSTGRTRMSPATFEQLAGAWSQFGFWANSLIFVFAAMLIPRMMADITWTQVMLIALLFAVTLLARGLMVFGVLPLLGLTRFGTKVSRAYRVVMWWGGLRGAVSLALALAVTEQHNVPYEARQFIAVATTGFVLVTLFCNGISLRWLIRRLRLNELTPFERSLRNQAVIVALDDLRDQTQDIAGSEHIGSEARERVLAVFDATQASLDGGELATLSLDQKVSIGLATIAAREEKLFFDTLKAQVVDWRAAESLLARAERMSDAVRAGGLKGFEAAISADLRYSFGFRMALRLHYLFGFQGWLAVELAKRFTNLMAKRGVAQELIKFAETDLQPLLGKDATDVIIEAHRHRLALLNNALQAMALQYPLFAQWLQESYLGRMARALERLRYRDMLAQFLITGEMYADLIKQAEYRWSHVKKPPALDISMSASDLIQRVPMFEGLDPGARAAICKVLKPRLAVPNQHIRMRFGRSRAMYVVASGAVVVQLPDGTSVELGTGEIFGEMALMGGEAFEADVRSLGYSRLLMLHESDFRKLLDRDAALRERIEAVVAQRRRALQVWREFQAGERQHEPLPDLGFPIGPQGLPGQS